HPYLPSYFYRPPRHLPSFPTRRSSDLTCRDTKTTKPPAGRGEGCIVVRSPAGRVKGALLGRPRHQGARGTCFGICQSSRRATSRDRKSTRLNSSHVAISYAVFCLKKKR